MQGYTPLSKIRLNPANPRIIRDEKYRKLVRSVAQFPKMLDLRGIVIDAGKMILGGNQRFRAIADILKMPEPELLEILEGRTAEFALWEILREKKAVPENWIVDGSDMTDDEIRRFIIADNVEFGEHDWDALANGWDAEELEGWGVDVPGIHGFSDKKKEDAEFAQWVPDCLFPSNNTYEIPTLRPDMQAGYITNPVTLWGVDKRTKKIDGGTILFYVDDYRFSALWDDPAAIQHTGCEAIAEPNVSLYDTMPVSYGLHLIFKKRWISRWCQEVGVKVFVDLNVSVKFAQYNLLGVPDGWNAFCTRGYSDRIKYLKEELNIAKKISGNDCPNMVVYGGGASVREFVAQNNLTYIETFRNFDTD